MKKVSAFFLNPRHIRWIFIGYGLYLLMLVYRSSFIVGHTRYFTLFDDMMISMRFAKHLAGGFGLVWNIGEAPVEGFTNLLWTLIMALFHFLPLPSNLMGLPVQLTAAVFMIANAYVIYKILLLLVRKNIVSVVGLFFVMFYYPLNNWGVVLGTETALLTFLFSISAYGLIKSFYDRKVRIWIFLLLGCMTLVRIDGLLPAIFFCLLYAWVVASQRKKIFIRGTCIVLGCFFVQEIFRFLYFGSFFPNTYYLKMTGYPLFWRIVRGLYVVPPIFNWMLLFPVAGYLFLKREKIIIALSLVFLGQVVYSVFVGGDAWEYFGGTNRYITPAMPLLFVVLVYVWFRVWSFAQKAMKSRSVFRAASVIALSFLVVSFLSFNTRSDNMLGNMLLITPPATIYENMLQVRMAQAVGRVTSPNAQVGVVWAGIVPYYTERRYIDLLGKNDSVISREQAKLMYQPARFFEKVRNFYPGHMKWDYAYALSKKPDLFAQIFPQTEEARVEVSGYKKMLSSEGFAFYFLPSSRNVRSDAL